MLTQAAVLREMGLPPPYAKSRPFEIVELDLADPGPGELRVKIMAAGLCHSDLSVVDGNRPRQMPMVLGHEAAGIVDVVGPGVRDLAPGDHVVLVFVPSCGHCERCWSGRPALCEPAAKANGSGVLLSGARRLGLGDEPINHLLGVAAFSQYAVVMQESCIKIDRDLSFAEAALFGCAVLTGVGAVFNTAAMPPGASVAVVGLGGVGLSCLLGARAAGARTVLAIDFVEERLAFARKLGATHTLNANEPDLVAKAKALTGGGPEYVFEMAGAVPALELALDITGRGGVTVTAGLPHPQKMLSFPALRLVAEERTLKGSYIGSCVPRRDLHRYIAMYREGRLPVAQLHTHDLRLDQINEGFDALRDGVGVRHVLLFD